MEQKYKRKRFDKGTFTKRKGEKDKYNVIYDQKKNVHDSGTSIAS